MNQNYNETIQFSKKEIRGIIALLFICVLLFFASSMIDFWNEKFSGREEELVDVQKIALEFRENETIFKDNTFRGLQNSSRDTKVYPFDPNKIDVKTWKEFGLSEKQAMSIINYISKGGRFYKAEDLGKMYVISPKMYEKLMPFVKIEGVISDSNVAKFEETSRNKVSTLPIININLADSLQLLELKGIGPAFARRIITYRKRLGGFINPEQMLEIYGFDSIRLNTIMPRLKFGNDLTLIDINTTTFDELRKHPYLSYSQAQAVIQYRKQHGLFKSEIDLMKVKALDTGVLRRLSPYLLF